jgi:hypothetical protein
MANLQSKAKKEAAHDAQKHKANLRATGFTVFRFDFAPKFTRHDLSLGDVIRELRLHPKIEPLLTTHDADLRQNLLGQQYG